MHSLAFLIKASYFYHFSNLWHIHAYQPSFFTYDVKCGNSALSRLQTPRGSPELWSWDSVQLCQRLSLRHHLSTIAPKLLYGRKECDLGTLLTPLVIHTLPYSCKWPRSHCKTLKKSISFFLSVWQCCYLYKPKDFHCNHFHSFISDNW